MAILSATAIRPWWQSVSKYFEDLHLCFMAQMQWGVWWTLWRDPWRPMEWRLLSIWEQAVTEPFRQKPAIKCEVVNSIAPYLPSMDAPTIIANAWDLSSLAVMWNWVTTSTITGMPMSMLMWLTSTHPSQARPQVRSTMPTNGLHAEWYLQHLRTTSTTSAEHWVSIPTSDVIRLTTEQPTQLSLHNAISARRMRWRECRSIRVHNCLKGTA